MITKIVNQRILTADEGHYLTNGETIAKTVVLPLAADPYVWCEISEKEAQDMIDAQETAPQ